ELEIEPGVTGRVVAEPRRSCPDENDLGDAVGLLVSARRPLVLAGRGAAGAKEDVLELARALDAPIATTLLANGDFNGEPRWIGTFGTLSSAVANDIIAKSDAIVAFGASLNWFTTAGGSLIANKRVVQCDSDPLALGRSYPIDVGLLGDSTLAAKRMLELIRQAASERPAFFTSVMAGQIEDYDPRRDFDDLSTDSTVDTRTAAIWLDEVVPRDRNVVTDGGRFLTPMLRYLHPSESSAYVLPVRFFAVGVGLPLAIGAACARPDRPTVFVAGDGGLMMSISELATAVQLGQDLITVVLNDGSYGQEVHRYLTAGMDPSLARLPWPDFAPIAEAFGAHGVTVRNCQDLAEAAMVISTRDRPVLIDIKVDPFAPTGYFDAASELTKELHWT
nr:thiamine pyrophosphate-dependent enzyme [Pseudomonadota bacterium]